MADPVVTTLTKDTWVKVATGVTTGLIHKMSKGINILQTYRDTTNPAPTDLTDAIRAFGDSHTEQISAGSPIDVYLYAQNQDGKVRIDL
jgi:hypothetical protein